jgi:amino acid permease
MDDDFPPPEGLQPCDDPSNAIRLPLETQSPDCQREVLQIGSCLTLINLINTMIGPEIVAIPATFQKSGIGPTVILLLISCGLCYVCGNILMALYRDLEAVGIDELARELFGKAGRVIISLVTMIFSFCCTVSCLIIATGKIADWLSLAGLNVRGTWPWAITCLCYSTIPVGLTIPRQIRFLSRIGPFSILMLVFYSVGMVIKGILTIPATGISTTVRGYKFGTDLMPAFAVHAVAGASCPLFMGPTLAAYHGDLRERKVILGASYVCSWILITMSGLFGYLLTGDSCQSDIFSSFAKDDILIILLQIGILLKVSYSYPLISTSLIGSLGDTMFEQNLGELLTGRQRLVILPIVNIINVGIAMFLKDVIPVLGVGGALGGCIGIFAFPSLCRLKITKDSLSTPKNVAHICLVVFGLAAAVVCTYFSIKTAIDSF